MKLLARQLILEKVASERNFEAYNLVYSLEYLWSDTKYSVWGTTFRYVTAAFAPSSNLSSLVGSAQLFAYGKS